MAAVALACGGSWPTQCLTARDCPPPPPTPGRDHRRRRRRPPPLRNPQQVAHRQCRIAMTWLSLVIVAIFPGLVTRPNAGGGVLSCAGYSATTRPTTSIPGRRPLVASSMPHSVPRCLYQDSWLRCLIPTPPPSNGSCEPHWTRRSSIHAARHDRGDVAVLPTPTEGWFPTRPMSTASDESISDHDHPPEPPREEDSDDPAHHHARAIERRAVARVARVIQHRLNHHTRTGESGSLPARRREEAWDVLPPSRRALVHDRFMDLASTVEGERWLEFFSGDPAFDDVPVDEETTDPDDAPTTAASPGDSDDVIRAAVMVLQSLCITGAHVGVKGSPDQLERARSHLDPRHSPALRHRDLYGQWDRDSVRRLKYRRDSAPAMALLAVLQWKRSNQGACDLLVALGVWHVHENVALIRSGFPLRFTDTEMAAAAHVAAVARRHDSNSHHQKDQDPDERLGLRRDLRALKVFTIDSASTSEIDDGLSVETIPRENDDDDGPPTQRLWIHIADVERWAPPGSDLFEMARKRITSLYLPEKALSMFPANVSHDVMSLNVGSDVCALSMGVELHADGTINLASMILTPSLIRVTYRLTYDEVDEMLDEGSAYREEWELGALLDAAKKRRAYRIRNGSTEGLIPTQIPYASVAVYPDDTAPNGVGISVKVQVSHNAGRNQTAAAVTGLQVRPAGMVVTEADAHVSASNLLVTEMMIVAGEAIGNLKKVTEADTEHRVPLMLPFRTQPTPDFKSRARERRVLEDLLEKNVGSGFCHAWYARRFLQGASVSETPKPHSGLGLTMYVQWSSPIRRFADLQTHVAVKRFLRRHRFLQMVRNGETLPTDLRAIDLGWTKQTMALVVEKGIEGIDPDELDSDDIHLAEGAGLMGAARQLQRQSQQYWLYESIRRLTEVDPKHKYAAIVLGCVDPEKQQYAIYLPELGMEHRYTSPGGSLNTGVTIQLMTGLVNPVAGLLNFVRIV